MKRALVNLSSGKAFVDYDSAAAGSAELMKVIRDEGFVSGAAVATIGIKGKRCHLQPDRDGQGKRSGALSIYETPL